MLLPGAGHLYTNDWRHGLLGIGLRALGFSTFHYGMTCCSDGDQPDQSLAYLGALIFTGGVLYSVIDAPLSARRYNRVHTQRWHITPGPIKGPGRESRVGVYLGTRF